MTLSPGRIRNGDVDLSYLVSDGTGSPVVVLHGLAGSSREFVATAEALSDRRVILIDARGHGGSTRRPADVSRGAHVDDVVRVIEEVAGGPVSLIGHSMGGHTALLTAASRPDLVEKLVLLEATVGGDGNAESREALHSYLESWPTPFATPDAAAAFLGTGPLARAWVQDLEHQSDGWRPRFDVDIMTSTLAHVDALPRWTEWERVSVPTLALFAEHGMFTGDVQREFLERGINVRGADIPVAGHDAHLDAFEEWVARVRDFLSV